MRPARCDLNGEVVLFAGILAMVLFASVAFDMAATHWINAIFVAGYVASRIGHYLLMTKPQP